MFHISGFCCTPMFVFELSPLGVLVMFAGQRFLQEVSCDGRAGGADLRNSAIFFSCPSGTGRRICNILF